MVLVRIASICPARLGRLRSFGKDRETLPRDWTTSTLDWELTSLIPDDVVKCTMIEFLGPDWLGDWGARSGGILGCSVPADRNRLNQTYYISERLVES